MTNTRPMRRLAALAAGSILVLAALTQSHAQDSSAAPASDAALIERVKREVLLELIEGGGLDAAIATGIERFVDRQRQARAEAQAQQQQGAAALAKNVRRVSAQRDHIYADAFRECLASQRYAARVQEDYDEGVAIGISGTPGTILLHNGSGEAIPRPGAVPVEAPMLGQIG